MRHYFSIGIAFFLTSFASAVVAQEPRYERVTPEVCNKITTITMSFAEAAGAMLRASPSDIQFVSAQWRQDVYGTSRCLIRVWHPKGKADCDVEVVSAQGGTIAATGTRMLEDGRVLRNAGQPCHY